MTGSLKKRSDNSWTIVLYLGRDPITGKKRQKWHTVTGNKKDAQRELTRLVHELDSGAYIEPVKFTLGEYLDRWTQDYAASNVSGKTLERYKGIIEHHLKPNLGSIPLQKLTPLHVQATYTTALQTGRKDKREGGLSAQTVLHHHRVLSEALSLAVRWGLLVRNPCLVVEPPRPERKEMQAIDESRAVWLIDAALKTRLHIPIMLAVTTGMRRGEILALRWQDCELTHGFLVARRSLQEIQAGVSFKSTKSRRARPISIPTLLVEALVAHKAAQERFKEALETGYEDNDLVCCVEDGRIWSQLLRAGVNPKVISERLGHSKVAFTLDVYSHLLPGMQEEAADKTDKALRAAIEKQRRPIA